MFILVLVSSLCLYLFLVKGKKSRDYKIIETTTHKFIREEEV